MRIFRVDDGATWHILAEDHAEARAVWLQACVDSHGHATEKETIDELGEPDIMVLQPVATAAITVLSDSKEDTCSKCGGRGKVPHYDSLLTVSKESTEARVLCCSEF